MQDCFIRGQINVLSCSTTFELGVDVGDLQAVLMRNVPPTTANYIQRAGRAGRRTDSVAFVLTYAQRRSHDLTHFNRPEKMVAGRILPPAVAVSNERIVRRHVHSVFLAAFFRWAKDQHQREFGTAGAFFAPEGGQLAGPDLLAEYIRLRPASLPEALLRIVPEDLHDLLDIAHWRWLPRLTDDAGTGILDIAAQEVNDDLRLYAELEDGLRKALHRLVFEEDVPAEDIVVLTPRSREKSRFWHSPDLGNLRLTDRWPPGPNEIYCTSVYLFKDLESPVVILTEIYPSANQDMEAVLYVGCSRARNHLVIFAESGLPDDIRSRLH